MRVLICPDRMGPLSSAAAARALAAGWPGAVIRPVGEAGAGFLEAVADGSGSELTTGVLDGALLETTRWDATVALRLSGGAPEPADASIPLQASSLVLGRALDTIVSGHRPQRLVADLAGLDVHDAGAGLLAGLGATASGAALTGGVACLRGLYGLDLAPVRDRLAGIELIGVVPSAERDDQLLGLRGITSRRGRAAKADAAVLLDTDATLQRLTELLSPDAAAAPGAGACGGLGWAVLAVGGRLATGPDVCLAGAGTGYDLVVTGCTRFDFATRGGGVVAAAAQRAADALAPCIVLAGEVLIGAREMRTMGIEAAYPVGEPSPAAATADGLTEADLAATVTRISRSWRW